MRWKIESSAAGSISLSKQMGNFMWRPVRNLPQRPDLVLCFVCESREPTAFVVPPKAQTHQFPVIPQNVIPSEAEESKPFIHNPRLPQPTHHSPHPRHPRLRHVPHLRLPAKERHPVPRYRAGTQVRGVESHVASVIPDPDREPPATSDGPDPRR